MKYVVSTTKSVQAVSDALPAAITGEGFGLLHVHDLKATMHAKGVEFGPECRVFEVCNPKRAHAVLSIDVQLNMALPCRISVWEEEGTVRIGTLNPTALIAVLNDAPELHAIAAEVEKTLHAIIEAVR